MDFNNFRISITCACSIHLALFPLDEQTGTLAVASCKIDLAFCILQLSFSLLFQMAGQRMTWFMFGRRGILFSWLEICHYLGASNWGLLGVSIVMLLLLQVSWNIGFYTSNKIFMVGDLLGSSTFFLNIFCFQANTRVYELIY